jgi:hypothetical protein
MSKGIMQKRETVRKVFRRLCNTFTPANRLAEILAQPSGYRKHFNDDVFKPASGQIQPKAGQEPR